MSRRRVAVGCALTLLVGAARTVLADEPSFMYEAKGHRDPFVPLVKDGRLIGASQDHPTDGVTPVLYGVLWDPSGNSIALINDAEVKVGDTVGTYVVQDIRQDSVVLSRDGGEPLVLKLAFELSPPSPSPTP